MPKGWCPPGKLCTRGILHMPYAGLKQQLWSDVPTTKQKATLKGLSTPPLPLILWKDVGVNSCEKTESGSKVQKQRKSAAALLLWLSEQKQNDHGIGEYFNLFIRSVIIVPEKYCSTGKF